MNNLRIYNSLSRQVEDFVPLGEDKVGMYTCGPTVYSYLTVGNWRTYVLSDLLNRTLTYFGYEVELVMNITDVGHLTGDNEGDASIGDDRLEKAAKREGRTAWDVAKFYADDFLRGYTAMNLLPPVTFCRATEHIQDQIDLVLAIEAAGFSYQIVDGIYFDVQSYEAAGHVYGELSNLDIIKEGARVAVNKVKKDPRDFALWKFNNTRMKRDMEWDSPWGVGFPGWHIECSAMGMKYLGEQFDIHIGGEDLRSTHHPNEIAQSEAGTGVKPFVKYWVHGAFLTVDGGRMGKSLGNAYTLQTLKKQNVEPTALRYFYLTGHYRQSLNFTWDAVHAARMALERIRRIVAGLPHTLEEMSQEAQKYRQEFEHALGDDLNMPQALAVVWRVVKSNDLPSKQRYTLLMDFDRVLGLGLNQVESRQAEAEEIPREVKQLVDAREGYRSVGEYENADAVRKKILSIGYEIEDTEAGSVVRKKL